MNIKERPIPNQTRTKTSIDTKVREGGRERENCTQKKHCQKASLNRHCQKTLVSVSIMPKSMTFKDTFVSKNEFMFLISI